MLFCIRGDEPCYWYAHSSKIVTTLNQLCLCQEAQVLTIKMILQRLCKMLQREWSYLSLTLGVNYSPGPLYNLQYPVLPGHGTCGGKIISQVAPMLFSSRSCVPLGAWWKVRKSIRNVAPTATSNRPIKIVLVHTWGWDIPVWMSCAENVMEGYCSQGDILCSFGLQVQTT